MAEQNKDKKIGTIKDRISGSRKGKKKIVIKKNAPAPKKKAITDYEKKPAQGPSRSPARPPSRRPAPPPPPAARQPARPASSPARPPQQGGRPPVRQQLPAGGGAAAPRRAPGGRPQAPAGQQRKAPDPQGKPGHRGPSSLFKGTPFDAAALEGARKQEGSAAGAGRTARPAGGGGGQRRGGSGVHDRRKDQERERASRFFKHSEPRKKKQATERGTTVPRVIEILESVQVGELAKKMNLRPGEVISRLMKLGEMVTINKIIDAETAGRLASEYNCEVKVVSLYEETVIDEETDEESARIIRPPVITIMGHVDHGKTKLLDAIRRTNVVDTEAGAITQHIGAYQVELKHENVSGKITLIDTPGHGAFTAMRARGVATTDIVVLVVAADDGVKEQTIEALHHAQQAKVPVIVAINKIDLEAADPERVKKELAQHGLQSEDFGGSTIFCEISAKQNIGIEYLLEMILLQAEMMELRANPNLRAVGTVLEAKIDPGKGPVATVLIQKGTVREGDCYVAGIFSGRVRAMFDDYNKRVKEAGPATPVEIIGINGVPQAGDPFDSVENEKYGREIASKRQYYQQITDAANRAQPSAASLSDWMQEQDVREVRVIIKADVQGSVEAIRDGLIKLSTDEVKVKVIHGATGAISESDVDLAKASDASIIGFQIKPTSRAQAHAERQRIDIKSYNVIYEVIDDIRNSVEGLLEPDTVEESLGRAEIREIFKISRIGNIAGCMVLTGKIKRSGQIRVLRNDKVIFTGALKSLKRHKEDVNDVGEGFECGLAVENYNNLNVGDQLESFEIKKIPRKLQD